MPKYLIIGNSAAGIGAVEGIRQIDKEGEIAIITNEPHHTYSRPLISYLLLGKSTEETMKYRSDSFYTDNNCRFIYGNVIQICEGEKCVVLEDSSRLPYEKLLVASGSTAFVPSFDGIDKVRDKFTFMSLDDARLLGNALAPDKRVLIIGAGLIGLKCAEGILERVREVTVVDLAPIILSSILNEEGAELVQKHLENQGITFILSQSVQRFEPNKAIFSNGEGVEFDILVLAVGVRPNVSLLEGIAQIGRGIIINEKSETTATDIYAAGDCTESLDVSSGKNKIMALLPNAYVQGECAGVNMAGGSRVFRNAIPMNAIGFFGLHIITAGNYMGEVYRESLGKDTNHNEKKGMNHKDGNGKGIQDRDRNENEVSFKLLYYSDNRLNGYILIGNVEKAGIYTSLIREQIPLDTIDFPLVCAKPGLMAFTKEDRMAKLGSVTR